MKCDDCFNLLEEYLDGEAATRDAEQVSAHLITCAACAHELEALTAEREIYARYDRELDVRPAMWSAIAARTAQSQPIETRERFSLAGWFAGLFATPGYAFAGAAAVVIFALLFGVVFLRTRTPKPPAQQTVAGLNSPTPKSSTTNSGEGNLPPPQATGTLAPAVDKRPVKAGSGTSLSNKPRRSDQPDVLFADAAYTDIEDKDTADHVAQAENLLRSVRNLQVSDDDDEVDVSYEKTTARRLLNENVVLRRDAEMAGKFPAKQLLGELEPFLIDIANLPDKTTPTDLRAINSRMQKTEIVAALRSY